MSTYIIAEIGINHDGSVERAVELIHAAANAGADAVKFQRRTPELCVPKDQWSVPKLTPWGDTMPYIEYRRLMEFRDHEVLDLHRAARECGIDLFWSVFDHGALEWAEQWGEPFVKIPSAKLTDLSLVEAAALSAARRGARGLILSTGMSTLAEIDAAVHLASGVLELGTPDHLDEPLLVVMHCHSAYPAPTEELNLSMIPVLWQRYEDANAVIGYSGHEFGRSPTEWAVALGAAFVERHITWSREAVGSDHSASLEPDQFGGLVRHIRSLDSALGDGVKRVWDSEIPARTKLRGDDQQGRDDASE